MELSPTKTKEANKYKVPVQYLLMADLCALGYTEVDAYNIAYPENSILSLQQNKGIRENILLSAKFKKVAEARYEIINHKQTEKASAKDNELMDKRQTAKLIMTAAMKQPADSKERIEGLMKFSDLMGYKKDDVSTGMAENINFFFPLKCNQCPLLYAYNEEMKKQGEQKTQPVEMERVIRLAHKIIQVAKEAD